MKYIKMLGLAAVAAAALMAFVGAGSASATELTCNGVKCVKGDTISASSALATLDAPFGDVECASTVHGTISNPGGTNATVSGPISELEFFNCADENDVVETLATGTLEIHTKTTKSDKNGTLTSSGARVTVEHFGFHCIFETSNTDIGTLTGGKTAVLDIEAIIPRVGGGSGGFCGSSAPWTGTYTVNTPDELIVH